MLNDQALEKQVEEIKLLIRYGVSEEEQALALDFLHHFASDSFAVTIIHDFYRTLPEAREEALQNIAVLERKEQVYLLLLNTARHHYFYLTNVEEGMFAGEWDNGTLEKQVLSFFDYPDMETFTAKYNSLESLREYSVLENASEEICPSCGVEIGSLHILGCPVEVCPWCEGQLNYCNCRFEQLGVEELIDEQMLEELENKLSQKGRIAYAKEQRPSFLSD